MDDHDEQKKRMEQNLIVSSGKSVAEVITLMSFCSSLVCLAALGFKRLTLR